MALCCVCWIGNANVFPPSGLEGRSTDTISRRTALKARPGATIETRKIQQRGTPRADFRSEPDAIFDMVRFSTCRFQPARISTRPRQCWGAQCDFQHGSKNRRRPRILGAISARANFSTPEALADFRRLRISTRRKTTRREFRRKGVRASANSPCKFQHVEGVSAGSFCSVLLGPSNTPHTTDPFRPFFSTDGTTRQTRAATGKTIARLRSRR